jgi:hypothetical protein
MGLVTAVLALAICLLGCAAPGGLASPTSAPSPVGITLKTIDMPEDCPADGALVDGACGTYCVLTYSVVDVAADPTFGTVDKTSGSPLAWPSGYTGRWAGPEVEVLDRAGKVVLTTGQRYRISPLYASYPDGPTAVCDPKPCVENNDPGTYFHCKLGESGPM